MTQTYVRGKRLLFSPNIFERAMPTSEEDTSSHNEAPLQDEEQVHLDTDIAYLEVHEEEKTIDQIIMEKEAEIIELKDNFSKKTLLVSFLQ